MLQKCWHCIVAIAYIPIVLISGEILWVIYQHYKIHRSHGAKTMQAQAVKSEHIKAEMREQDKQSKTYLSAQNAQSTMQDGHEMDEQARQALNGIHTIAL